MKKYLLTVFLFLYIFRSFLIGEGDIHKYTSKGREGYVSDFTNDIAGNDKGTFWISFVTFIKSASSNNEFKNILECQEFWKYYQNDGFFIKKEQDALFSREYDDVVKVFDEAVKNYWKNILARMFRLEEINDKVEDVKKYTQNNEYSNILKSYITIYNELKNFNAPKGKVELDNFRNNFSKLLQVAANVADNITKPIINYCDSWEAYFSIPIPGGAGNYLAKSEAYKKRKEKLEIIEPLTKEISLFNISNHKEEINKRKKDWETNEKYYAIHSEIDNLIELFKNNPLPEAEDDIVGKWNELVEVKNKITKLRGLVKPEPELLEKIKEFESIPSENKMEALESYFKSHSNSTDIIAKIINAKFKNQLIQSIERLWDKGPLNTCKNVVQKYTKYFGTCKYGSYFSFIEAYDSIKDEVNKGKKGKIIELYCSAKNYTDYNLVQKKRKLTPLDTLKREYKKYVNEEAQKVFPKEPDGKERNQSDFDNFLNIYRKARKDMDDFSLNEPYASKFSALYSYYYGKDEKEKKSAEQDIVKDPVLVMAYGIKIPTPSTPTGRINPAETSSGSVRMETGTTVGSSQAHTDAYKTLENLWIESKTRKMVDLINCIIQNEKLSFAGQGEANSALNRLIEYKKNIDNGQIYPADKSAFLYMLSEILGSTGNEGEQLNILEQLKMLPDFSNFKLPIELDKKGQINKSHIENQYEAIKYFNSVANIYKKNSEKRFDNSSEEGNFIKDVKIILNPGISEKLQPAQDARLNYMTAMIYKDNTEKFFLGCFHFYKCYKKMNTENFEKLVTYENGNEFSKEEVINFLVESFNKNKNNAKEDFKKELIIQYTYTLEDKDYEELKKLIIEIDNFDENQNYVDFLKALLEYSKKAGENYTGKFKVVLDKIFMDKKDETKKNLNPAPFLEFRTFEKLPETFDYETYRFIRACFYGKYGQKKEEFKKLIENQKNEEIRIILQELFDEYIK